MFVRICSSHGRVITLVSEKLKLVGEWDQPGGDKKVFTDSNTSISWRKGRWNLQFSGKDAEKLKRIMACLIICTENVNTQRVTTAHLLTALLVQVVLYAHI